MWLQPTATPNVRMEGRVFALENADVFQDMEGDTVTKVSRVSVMWLCKLNIWSVQQLLWSCWQGLCDLEESESRLLYKSAWTSVFMRPFIWIRPAVTALPCDTVEIYHLSPTHSGFCFTRHTLTFSQRVEEQDFSQEQNCSRSSCSKYFSRGSTLTVSYHK